MTIKYIDGIDLKGKRVMVRVDYNVPYDKEMNITDDTRITATLPTVNYCLEKGCKIILVSHMGRPKGKPVPEMSLKPVSARLGELLKRRYFHQPARRRGDRSGQRDAGRRHRPP